jgi:RNAse (barnase) inhibitor barstar
LELYAQRDGLSLKRDLYFSPEHLESDEQFCREIQELLGVPAFYHPTLDGLYEALLTVDSPVTLTIHNFPQLANVFPHQMAGLEETFLNADKQNPHLEIRLGRT